MYFVLTVHVVAIGGVEAVRLDLVVTVNRVTDMGDVLIGEPGWACKVHHTSNGL